MANPFPQKAQCLVCAKPRKSRGLCSKHYMQLRAAGYNPAKTNWYTKVKDAPSALALLMGTDPVPGPVLPAVPSANPPPAPSHDAWVAAYAYCQLKGESMDALLNALVTDWYTRTFPALAKGAAPTVTVHVPPTH